MSARAAIAAVCAVAPMLTLAPQAFAGSYEVKFCDGISASGTPASPDGRGFAFSASSPTMVSGAIQCPTNADPTRGMAQRNRRNSGVAPAFAAAAATFTAPSGAVIRTLKWRGLMHRSECHWSVGVLARGSIIAGLSANADCGINAVDWPTEFTWNIDSGSFAFVAACGNWTGCDTAHDSSAPTPGARALMRTYSARVAVEDGTLPEFQNVTGGLAGGSWVRGTQSLALDAVDNVGIRESRFAIDANQMGAGQQSCDYALARPCPSPVGLTYQADTSLLTEGEHRASVTAVDTAGNVGTVERTFLVDNTAPARPEAVSVDGGAGWRRANSFGVSWTNPGGQKAPIVAAHYSLCPAGGGDCARGSRSGESIAGLSDLQLPRPGDYVLRVWLEDAAGNVDEQAASDAVHLRFDDRPPAASFDPSDPADPLAVRVSVTDEHSGLGGGEIEVQPAGGTTWTVLPTHVDGSQLVGRIDDQRLRDGSYALRARVVDAAGNAAMTERRADGSAARFSLPLRVVTGLRVGVRRVVKSRRRGRGRVRKAVRLVPRARVRLGRKLAVRGRLANRDGQPVDGASIEVFGRSRSAGARFEPLGTVATDPAGRFRYQARARRSRLIRFVYRGTPTVRPAVTDMTLAVRAASTFEASRRATLNGARVRFSGRLKGRPLPAGGKLVELQAHYRGRWRTFATPRAGRRGDWAFTYKFGATVGRVVYPFRAVIPRDDLYPFARGYSRVVRVTVRGR